MEPRDDARPVRDAPRPRARPSLLRACVALAVLAAAGTVAAGMPSRPPPVRNPRGCPARRPRLGAACPRSAVGLVCEYYADRMHASPPTRRSCARAGAAAGAVWSEVRANVQ